MRADREASESKHNPVHAWLEADLDAEPIEGTLSPPDGPPAPFTGWLGLTTALETLRRTLPGPNGPNHD